MSRSTLRTLFLVGAPLILAAVLTQHPLDGDTFYEVIKSDTSAWIGVHLVGAVGFPLMALVVYLTVQGVPGRAAKLSRYALLPYLLLFGVFEAIVGIGAGVLVQGADLSAAQGEEAVDALTMGSLVPTLGGLGALAWLVSVGAAIVALRGTEVPRVALGFLALAIPLGAHIPPLDAIPMTALAIGALLVERSRRRAAQVAGSGSPPSGRTSRAVPIATTPSPARRTRARLPGAAGRRAGRPPSAPHTAPTRRRPGQERAPRRRRAH